MLRNVNSTGAPFGGCALAHAQLKSRPLAPHTEAFLDAAGRRLFAGCYGEDSMKDSAGKTDYAGSIPLKPSPDAPILPHRPLAARAIRRGGLPAGALTRENGSLER